MPEQNDKCASPAALTDYSYQQLFDAISAAAKVTSGTEHISISVDAFRAALIAAPPAVLTDATPVADSLEAMYAAGNWPLPPGAYNVERTLNFAASPAALTDEQIRDIALKYCRFVFPGVYSIKEFDCEEDFLNCARALLAASPAAQGEDARDAALSALVTAESELRDLDFEHPSRKEIRAAIAALKGGA